jgi:hypothetical protein
MGLAVLLSRFERCSGSENAVHHLHYYNYEAPPEISPEVLRYQTSMT